MYHEQTWREMPRAGIMQRIAARINAEIAATFTEARNDDGTASTVPELPRCPSCGQRHPPLPREVIAWLEQQRVRQQALPSPEVPVRIFGMPAVMQDLLAPLGRVYLMDPRYVVRLEPEPLVLGDPLPPLPDTDLDESLQCCGETFAHHTAWWQHRKREHQREDADRYQEAIDEGIVPKPRSQMLRPEEG